MVAQAQRTQDPTPIHARLPMGPRNQMQLRKMVEKMKPGIINTEYMSDEQITRVWKWLVTNGCRHHVPRWASIIFTGNRLVVPTFDIERVGQKNKKWARNRWIWIDGEKTLPIKNRTYRIRVPFEAIK